MLLIPAIDIKDGQCVRLQQGRMDDVTVFSEDPIAVAVQWLDAGCRRLHVVDLDGAFAGEPRNRLLIQAITERMGSIPVQVGGGIRNLETIAAYLEAGVAQVIVGTRAVEEPSFLEEATRAYPDRVTLGLDARNGQLATEGWDQTSTASALEFARWAGELAIAAIVYTDIERDGMLSGLNVDGTVQIAEVCNAPVIASGGVTDLTDLEKLKSAFQDSTGTLLGAITGRAIYAGTLDFRAGQTLLDGAG
ncbi:MAG: 1-(5-phosphoribosyl)-5-[(5-phosphoribosylamino)methylideneamino]imidazole-4-carboxamide isomerase [Gammaproteobacteria bacterium]|nr:1-(5-phosphoribosyl)-5-[(5-phosphoribosylamino)methylideneamino]imidazole-4-carboxamide isomerase [Gammaproteobacteria bacterium]MCZ6854318.1 1-(5-phosphoribosyl)-5-[(5-phosphoribosylamino)methylideneamino]imidazole-4-carboxamide isomerase [Gammaproteobacteria bacterium]